MRPLVGLVAAAAAALALGSESAAHKPITSPFTFNEDVFPIMRDRCAACHVPGGVAPMSLLTHPETVPWGESIRVELLSGHMPPWSIDSAPARFRNVRMLSAREMNVLLTWVSGGTPSGDPAKPPPPLEQESTWPLGMPDLVVPMPQDVTLTAEMQEHVTEFTVSLPAGSPRALRAVDLMPGTPAIVRSAVVSTTGAAGDDAGGAIAPERILAVWVPGDHQLPLDDGAAFVVPPDGRITVRVRYRKTWQHERATLTDRSRLGVYFAKEPASELRTVVVTPAGTTTREPLQAVAIYPEAGLTGVHVTVVATRPNGSREELIAFRPQAGWARRYWFAEPVALPAGTRLEVRVAPDSEELLPPGALPPQPADPSRVRLTLNVLAGPS
jgi:hypothetical protein